MSSADDVRDYLDYYLSEERALDYAMMLTGPWGAGKTFFIKSYFKDRAAQQLTSAAQATAGYLYASLYGVTSVEAITEQFFAQAHPILSSKTVRVLGAVASRIVNGVVGVEVSTTAENNNAIKEMALNLEGRALIFDDLERCSMSISDVMGFINAYVEHEGLKVIVIANENDIPDAQKDEYFRKKEKLIGKTLEVVTDASEVFDNFLQALSVQSVIDTLRNHKTALLNTFSASGKNNFRSLRSIMLDYERLVSRIDARILKSSEASERLLLYVAAAGMEYRSGDLRFDDFSKLTSFSYKVNLNRPDSREQAQVKIDAVREKYPDVRWTDPIVPPENLAQLFKAGTVDVGQVNEYLDQHPAIVGHDQIPPWRLLWSWDRLTRKEYMAARDAVLVQLNKFEITHPGIILHVAGRFLMLETYGDRPLGRPAAILKYFKDYLRHMIEEKKLEPHRDLFGPMGGAYAGLAYPSRESEAFKKIYKLVEMATDQMFDERMKVIAADYLERFETDDDAYIALREYGFDRGYYRDAAFLHHIDPQEFANLIIDDGALNERLLASLYARYEHEAHNPKLAKEYAWVSKMSAALRRLASQAQPPQRKLIRDHVDYYLKKIKVSIEEAKKA